MAEDSRMAGLGAALGGGFRGLGYNVGQNLAERRMAKQLNPMRQALLDSQPYDGPMASLQSQVAANEAQQNYTPEQQMIMRSAHDPRLFARIAGNPAGALALGNQMTPPTIQTSTIVHANTPEGERLGLQGAESAEVNTKTTRGKFSGRDIQGFHTTKDNTPSNEHGMFGDSVEGKTLEYMTKLAPSFAKAETTPDEERAMLTSVVNYTQPSQYKDPDTDLLVTKRKDLPKYVMDALQARGYNYTQETGLIPPVARQKNPADIQAGRAAAAAGQPITPPAPDMPSLYELAASGKLTGPAPELGRALDRMPLIGGGIAPEQTSIKGYTEGLLNRYVNALRMNPRYAQSEANDLSKRIIDLEPKTWDNPANYQSRVIGFDDLLKSIEDQSREVVEGKRALVSGETRKHAMDTLQATQAARKTLMPPRLSSRQELDEFERTHVPGDKYMVKNKAGQWVVFDVPQRGQ